MNLVIWVILVVGTNLTLKRIFEVGFWDSLGRSRRFSKRSADITQFIFVFCCMLALHLFVLGD
jgi:hypothetical protein